MRTKFYLVYSFPRQLFDYCDEYGSEIELLKHMHHLEMKTGLDS